jgi:hypothetical protein
MKKSRKIILFFIIAVLSIISGLRFTNQCIVFEVSDTPENHVVNMVKGDTIKPLSSFDFSKGKWKSYVTIAPSDIQTLNANLIFGRCLITKDSEILNKMKEDWAFIYNEADMATVESKFYLFQDGKIVFKCGIVLDTQTQGLQSGDFGWVEANNNEIVNAIKCFKKIKFPIVVL